MPETAFSSLILESCFHIYLKALPLPLRWKCESNPITQHIKKQLTSPSWFSLKYPLASQTSSAFKWRNRNNRTRYRNPGRAAGFPGWYLGQYAVCRSESGPGWPATLPRTMKRRHGELLSYSTDLSCLVCILSAQSQSSLPIIGDGADPRAY